MGKDWAKGLTKDTDARVARAAAGHRGLTYVRRTPFDEQRSAGAVSRRVPLVWTPALAYGIGLIATDGCLSSSGRHVFFVSKDRDLAETLLRCLGSDARIRSVSGRTGVYYRTTISDVQFYRWLLTLGLTPKKSLTLGALQIPKIHVLSAVRGLLDGDGSIRSDTVIPNPRRYPQHTYRRLNVTFLSASRPHVEWIASMLANQLGVHGAIVVEGAKRGNPLYLLRYGKHASVTVLEALYADPDAPRLERKWHIWEEYRNDPPMVRAWTRRTSAVPEAGFEPALNAF